MPGWRCYRDRSIAKPLQVQSESSTYNQTLIFLQVVYLAQGIPQSSARKVTDFLSTCQLLLNVGVVYLSKVESLVLYSRKGIVTTHYYYEIFIFPHHKSLVVMVSRILYITSTGKSGKCVNRHGFLIFFFVLFCMRIGVVKVVWFFKCCNR